MTTTTRKQQQKQQQQQQRSFEKNIVRQIELEETFFSGGSSALCMFNNV